MENRMENKNECHVANESSGPAKEDEQRSIVLKTIPRSLHHVRLYCFRTCKIAENALGYCETFFISSFRFKTWNFSCPTPHKRWKHYVRPSDCALINNSYSLTSLLSFLF